MKKIIIIVFALLCGAVVSQFPEFAQQYRQRLSGAVNELSMITQQFDTDAQNAGLSREDALARYKASNDDFLEDRGLSMADVIRRHERLSLHLKRLSEAGPFARLWVFANEQESEFTSATLDVYEPAIPITTEGIAHAAGGFGAIWLFLSGLFGVKRRRRKAA